MRHLRAVGGGPFAMHDFDKDGPSPIVDDEMLSELLGAVHCEECLRVYAAWLEAEREYVKFRIARLEREKAGAS